MIRPVSLPLLASLAAMVPVAGVVAEDLPTATVSYADLNLSSAAGQASLRHRLVAAARRVCGDADMRDLVATRDQAACRRAAASSAATQMASLVTASQRALAEREAARLTELAALARR